MISNQSHLRTLALSAGLLAAACGSSSHSSPPPVVQGPDYFYEIEPNDTPAFPDFIQYVDRFTDTIIEGRLDGGPFGLYDTYDHFEFVTNSEAEFVFELYTEAPFADFAVGIFDPFLGEMVLWWDNPGSTEFGSFVVHQPGTVFQIVVHAPDFGANYSLDLFGFPYPYYGPSADAPDGPDGIEPGAAPESGGQRITAGTLDVELQRVPDRNREAPLEIGPEASRGDA